MKTPWISPDRRIALYHGDCLDVLPGLERSAIDSVITDPPYGLSFIGKTWDHGVPGPEFWRAVADVCKPGTLMMAFGGTRTFHRLACAIEDAGWEIRDTIMWIYGSGFPKSLDVGKAIDKSGGKQIGWFGQWLRKWRKETATPMREVAALFPSKTGGMTGCVSNWELGLNIPSPEQFNLIAATFGLPFESIEQLEREVIGKAPWSNSAKHFTPGEDHTQRVNLDVTSPATDAAKTWDGWGTALKPAHEPITVAMKALDGTFAQNALTHGVAGLNVDGCRVGVEGGTRKAGPPSYKPGSTLGASLNGGGVEPIDAGRWPANVIHDGSDEVMAEFAKASESGPDHRSLPPGTGGMWKGFSNTPFGPTYPDSGSAARFFYTAKASPAERGEGNTHPTVKPLALMKYLAKLTRTPASGVVLDPFMGSGTTAIAAHQTGRSFVGIEKDEESFEIARQRIEAYLEALGGDMFGAEMSLNGDL